MSKYSQYEAAILERGYETGGFPINKKQLIEIFNQNESKEFEILLERMRHALMKIYHEQMTMEQVSSVAHICAVVALHLETKKLPDAVMKLVNSEALALLDKISAEIDGQQTYKMFDYSRNVLIMKAKAKEVIQAERSKYEIN